MHRPGLSVVIGTRASGQFFHRMVENLPITAACRWETLAGRDAAGNEPLIIGDYIVPPAGLEAAILAALASRSGRAGPATKR